MKLAAVERDSFTIGESVDTIQVGINRDAEGLVMRAFADNIYTDKIGSVVREIASNCVDAHEEVNQQRPFEIEYIDDSESRNIIFRDFGPGLSPDRVRNIFSQYFSSTKRDSNNQIGGWGIGSKSPYAYTDIYHVRTRWSNRLYFYELKRGDKSPVITKISDKEDIGVNMTEIIIPIKNSGDFNSFSNAITTQLAFFENIKCIKIAETMNNRTIYEGDCWAISSETKYEYPRAIIGNVVYPLGSKVLDFLIKKVNPSVSSWNTSFYYKELGNFALKFDIGELPVTMSREAIEDKEGILEKIAAKYFSAKGDLIEKYVPDLESGAYGWKEFGDIFRSMKSKAYTHRFDSSTSIVFPIGESVFRGKDKVSLKHSPFTLKDFVSFPSLDDLFYDHFVVDRFDGNRYTSGGKQFKNTVKPEDFVAEFGKLPIMTQGVSKYKDWHLIVDVTKHKDSCRIFKKKSYLNWNNYLDKHHSKGAEKLKKALILNYQEVFYFYDRLELDSETIATYRETLKVQTKEKLVLGTEEFSGQRVACILPESFRTESGSEKWTAAKLKEQDMDLIYVTTADRSNINLHLILTSGYSYGDFYRLNQDGTRSDRKTLVLLLSKSNVKKVEKMGIGFSAKTLAEAAALKKGKAPWLESSKYSRLLNSNLILKYENIKEFRKGGEPIFNKNVEFSKLVAYETAVKIHEIELERAHPVLEIPEYLKEHKQKALNAVKARVLKTALIIHNQIKTDESKTVFKQLWQHIVPNSKWGRSIHNNNS